jgi:hypothetical protein
VEEERKKNCFGALDTLRGGIIWKHRQRSLSLFILVAAVCLRGELSELLRKFARDQAQVQVVLRGKTKNNNNNNKETSKCFKK